MKIIIRNIGNSKGMVLPKPLLEQVGLDESSVAQLDVENGAIVLRRPTPGTRAGCAGRGAGEGRCAADGRIRQRRRRRSGMVTVRRGDIWLVNLDPTMGSEIQKTRPCVVISPP